MVLKRKGGGLKHSPLKHSDSSSLKKTKSKLKTEEQRDEKQKMKDFFLYLWSIRPHYSEVSGKWLGNECKSIFQHHIIPKSTCLEGKYDPENIIFLTPEEHVKVESDIYCFEEVNIRRKKLKEKYATN